ncbi:site-2 protease family protein [Maribacter confluentis]|uniref:Zinc metalloprotease n=1 Tax=Maribacter confluentis TaxID=1656093 RepID=A0ABT8RNA8_9FLAO|nr:site-2 protease family protein [Maribacter confluentis]MDO1511621.1 site-2 protease family protein [Maribacter confluentis]MDO1514878.1 site-2 protease family protein [Maribacter confluentis]
MTIVIGIDLGLEYLGEKLVVMKGVMRLGKVSGIKIEVHWTFILLLLWVAFLEFQKGSGLNRILLNEALIVVLFFCVVLHELGHALIAKYFGVQTKNILLLPIGGVATLEKMPEKPAQEFWIALAGPAVNIIIAILLLLVVPVRSYFNFDAIVMEELLYEPTLRNFLFYLFLANAMLVVFNLIPAFPMDGGRVLRALLSFNLGRVKATEIAASLGQGLAMIFFVLGLFFNPFLILIALFIFLAAYGENQMVKQGDLLKGYSVQDATMTNITQLNTHSKVKEVIAILLGGTEKDFVVVDNGKIVGILTQKNIIEHAKAPETLVGSIMQTKFSTVNLSEGLMKVLQLLERERNGFFPVLEQGKLVGVIDKTNISELILLRTAAT